MIHLVTVITNINMEILNEFMIYFKRLEILKSNKSIETTNDIKLL